MRPFSSYFLPALALFGAGLWELCLHLPRSMDPDGVNAVVFCILVDLGFLAIGVTSLFLSYRSEFSKPLALTILFTPLLHYAGAPINAPWCYPLFYGPFIAMLVLTLRYWSSPYRPAQTPPRPHLRGRHPPAPRS